MAQYKPVLRTWVWYLDSKIEIQDYLKNSYMILDFSGLKYFPALSISQLCDILDTQTGEYVERISTEVYEDLVRSGDWELYKDLTVYASHIAARWAKVKSEAFSAFDKLDRDSTWDFTFAICNNLEIVPAWSYEKSKLDDSTKTILTITTEENLPSHLLKKL